MSSAKDKLIPHLALQMLPKAPRMHLAYTFWSLVPVQLAILHLAMAKNTQHDMGIHMVPHMS